ncbi:hypothetical protein BDR05DRAFT_949435 [Suillus weaverae]|nr:hypothetical protein BDR05DRAFT_949435 [Suillus weaverae]
METWFSIKSQLAAPDHVLRLPLVRSPLKHARITSRSRLHLDSNEQKEGEGGMDIEEEEDENENDEILLSPKKNKWLSDTCSKDLLSPTNYQQAKEPCIDITISQEKVGSFVCAATESACHITNGKANTCFVFSGHACSVPLPTDHVPELDLRTLSPMHLPRKVPNQLKITPVTIPTEAAQASPLTPLSAIDDSAPSTEHAMDVDTMPAMSHFTNVPNFDFKLPDTTNLITHVELTTPQNLTGYPLHVTLSPLTPLLPTSCIGDVLAHPMVQWLCPMVRFEGKPAILNLLSLGLYRSGIQPWSKCTLNMRQLYMCFQEFMVDKIFGQYLQERKIRKHDGEHNLVQLTLTKVYKLFLTDMWNTFEAQWPECNCAHSNIPVEGDLMVDEIKALTIVKSKQKLMIQTWYRWQTNAACLVRSGGLKGALGLSETLSRGDEVLGQALQEVEVYSHYFYNEHVKGEADAAIKAEGISTHGKKLARWKDLTQVRYTSEDDDIRAEVQEKHQEALASWKEKWELARAGFIQEVEQEDKIKRGGFSFPFIAGGWDPTTGDIVVLDYHLGETDVGSEFSAQYTGFGEFQTAYTDFVKLALAHDDNMQAVTAADNADESPMTPMSFLGWVVKQTRKKQRKEGRDNTVPGMELNGLYEFNLLPNPQAVTHLLTTPPPHSDYQLVPLSASGINMIDSNTCHEPLTSLPVSHQEDSTDPLSITPSSASSINMLVDSNLNICHEPLTSLRVGLQDDPGGHQVHMCAHQSQLVKKITSGRHEDNGTKILRKPSNESHGKLEQGTNSPCSLKSEVTMRKRKKQALQYWEGDQY